MSRDFLVTVTGPRRKTFEDIFESGTVYVKAPIPVMAKLEGFVELMPCYELDVELLTVDQRHNLINFLASSRGVETHEVELSLKLYGMPILAEGCIVTVLKPLWGHV